MMFDVEEMNLLYLFDTTSRKAAAKDLMAAFPLLETRTLKKIGNRVLRKLEQMTDEEFQKIDFTESRKDAFDEAL